MAIISRADSVFMPKSNCKVKPFGWIKGSLEARAKARATKFSTTELLDLHSDQTQDVGFVLTRQ